MKLLGVLVAQIDLVLVAVDRECDVLPRTFGDLFVVEIVDELDEDLLGHDDGLSSGVRYELIMPFKHMAQTTTMARSETPSHRTAS